MRSLVPLSLLVVSCAQPKVSPPAPSARPAADSIYLLIRSDDGGMSHAVNMGLKRLVESGLPVSVSVMFPTPWYQEAVEILKRHPDVAVGVHLTLNSEWKNYRWGPVAGATTVPTLVDSNGYFFHSGADLYANNPDVAQVEAELRAQLERAKRSGLRIDYVDTHMGTIARRPDFRDVAEKLAREYGLGFPRYWGESSHDAQYRAAPANKADSLVAIVSRLNPGLNLLVTHVGIDTPELAALVDMNVINPLPDMSANREGELNGLLSREFRESLAKRGVRLITYRQLIEIRGLGAMRRP